VPDMDIPYNPHDDYPASNNDDDDMDNPFDPYDDCTVPNNDEMDNAIPGNGNHDDMPGDGSPDYQPGVWSPSDIEYVDMNFSTKLDDSIDFVSLKSEKNSRMKTMRTWIVSSAENSL